MKRTYQPSKIRRTRNGRKVLARRRAKGRKNLSA